MRLTQETTQVKIFMLIWEKSNSKITPDGYAHYGGRPKTPETTEKLASFRDAPPGHPTG
jgi:hypothetical protein